MASILRVKDQNNNIIEIPAIRGASAYEVAVDNGFEGTEEEWLVSLKAAMTTEQLKEFNLNINQRHKHDNKDVIKLLSHDIDFGFLAYNGVPLAKSKDIKEPFVAIDVDEILSGAISETTGGYVGGTALKHFYENYVKTDTETVILLGEEELALVAEDNNKIILGTYSEKLELNKEIVSVKFTIKSEVDEEGNDVYETYDLRDMIEKDGVPYFINGRKTFIHPVWGSTCFGVVVFPYGTNFFYPYAEVNQATSVEITYKK